MCFTIVDNTFIDLFNTIGLVFYIILIHVLLNKKYFDNINKNCCLIENIIMIVLETKNN